MLGGGEGGGALLPLPPSRSTPVTRHPLRPAHFTAPGGALAPPRPLTTLSSIHPHPQILDAMSVLQARSVDLDTSLIDKRIDQVSPAALVSPHASPPRCPPPFTPLPAALLTQHPPPPHPTPTTFR